MTRLRKAIRSYNDARGVPNTTTSGYHESITRFYVWQIDRFLAQADRSLPVDELAEALIRNCGDRSLPLRYWSEPVLMSTAARLGWVEPDRQPLPGPSADSDP